MPFIAHLIVEIAAEYWWVMLAFAIAGSLILYFTEGREDFQAGVYLAAGVIYFVVINNATFEVLSKEELPENANAAWLVFVLIAAICIVMYLTHQLASLLRDLAKLIISRKSE